ncbi:hypothetical protein J422_06194 [Methanocaldococcus villosus KIN24-T80]|uniref:YibE/F family protein n=1 Tax=Methanocaldococcus villosus KIN24-T80 TaxID=1069083 RepID=N6VX81_9EURY|nr:YibE/F family protein [Methanocaldococcus villosus]ENN95722.1 hypothetical protein J422_06194 [Methanocaldococcus villosus KIN24-T80]
MKNKIYIIFLFAILLLSVILVVINYNYKNDYSIKKGVVIKTYDNIDYTAPIKIGFQIVYVNVSGNIIKFNNVLRGNFLLDNYFKKGDHVVVVYKDNTPIYLAYDRVFWIIMFSILFLGLLFLIGGFNGFKTVLSLIFTVVVIYYILLPNIANGTPPITLTIIIILLIVFISYFILCGFNKKAICSALGAIFGVVISGIVGYIGINLMNLPPGGFSEFVEMILFSGHYLDFYGVFISSILLASLGAIMDVSIDISSGLYELKRHKPDISFKEMFKSGMNIGRDIMGTMANTLILVYVGSLMAPILYFIIKNTPMEIIFSYNIIASEVLASLAGSIGVVMTVPITVILASYLYTKVE